MKHLLQLIGFFVFYIAFSAEADPTELREEYERHCHEPSDIYEHIPVLYSLAKECTSVVEIGVRDMISSWGILQGLAESGSAEPSYLGIDIKFPPNDIFQKAQRLAESNQISFRFLQENDMHIHLDKSVDMLFIDSLHTYCHLSYELVLS